MAIGIGTALLGGAAISGIGSIIGGSKQSKAARQAAAISADQNAADRAFLTDIYNRNVGYLSPFMGPGAFYGQQMMELLGFGAQGGAQGGAAAFPQYGQGWTGDPSYSMSAAGGAYPYAQNTGAFSLGEPIYVNGQTFGGGEPVPTFGYSPVGRYGLTMGGEYAMGGAPAFAAAPSTGAVTTTLPSARSAFDAYRGSTGYDFRFNEGTRALQSAFSRNLDSGAATRAAIRFGQGIASDEFGNYYNRLADQQRLAFGAASALTGVGQNFGNTITANNTAAANAQANARLYAGNVAANNWANLGSSFGSALGYFAR